jgi:uncharacterized protein (UPF0332 family)
MTSEQLFLLQKAEDSIRAAKLLMEGELFYLAQAFLLGDGLSFSSHSAVIAAFGREFARTERLPKTLHRF